MGEKGWQAITRENYRRLLSLGGWLQVSITRDSQTYLDVLSGFMHAGIVLVAAEGRECHGGMSKYSE